MNWTAKWIWDSPEPCKDYNTTVEARKRFDAKNPVQAVVSVTADSWYRLFLNGEWVADGPCRSYPEHYQYDVIDVSSHVQDGENEITIVARYFGVGTFHQIPRQGGLLAQLDISDADGAKTCVGSDESWEIMRVPALRANAPKVSVQMEPYEWFDARIDGAADFSPAHVVCAPGEGPWSDLNPRDVALLTRTPFAAKSVPGACVVDSAWQGYSFPVGRLIYPGLIEANARVSRACVLATCIEAPEDGDVRIESRFLRVTVNGDLGKDGVYSVKKGSNLLLAVVSAYFSHWATDVAVRFDGAEPVSLASPLDGATDAPWTFVRLPECELVGDDLNWQLANGSVEDPVRQRIDAVLADVQRRVATPEEFRSTFSDRAVALDPDEQVSDDPHWRFLSRKVVGDAAGLVSHPEALLHDNGAYTTVHPSDQGDVELLLDFGEQNCGYYEIDLIADEGVVLDFSGVEYIAPSGSIQHTNEYRNGMRYVCRQGLNRFLSFKRRSQRYLFVTLRNQHAPVRIRQIRLVESTYPVHCLGAFSCSDPHLDRIWDISVRTLKLCMEDTFTDCPLYEQTLWVGDARNEAVFAFTAFGATDIARRCISIAGQSLERYPIVGCQVPSAWDTLIPAWSCMWGLSVWDYYSYSGDIEFLRRVWPWVMRNLKGASELLDERGLFSGPFWNMFDWTPVDDRHCTVVHNSMFLVGAIDAAVRCGEALEAKDDIAWMSKQRAGLVAAINALWDDARNAYPDSIRDDGVVSDSICQHTSFLGLLYDIVPEDKRAAAFRNLTDPPEGMVPVGSPFAIMYLYETLEKLGEDERILDDILKNYMPMIELAATTVWETFSSGLHGWGEFPTRSHCHAWSSAPVHFLNRIVLGIRQRGVGGKACEISPYVARHEWARGATQFVQGPVKVQWRKEGGKLRILASGPEGVELTYRGNPTHDGLEVEFNGQRV